MAHEWFNNIDFEKLVKRDIDPEFLPDITRANCETSPEDLSALFLPPPVEEPVTRKLCY